jgi:hypothetical protein
MVVITFIPLPVLPLISAPRDLCLVRYWKHNDADGSYVVCLDSTFHLGENQLLGMEIYHCDNYWGWRFITVTNEKGVLDAHFDLLVC